MLTNHFESQQFPSLNEKSLEDLIKNVPSLKSIKLDPKFISGISHHFIFKILKDENVIILVQYDFDKRNLQMKLVEFLKEMAIYEKYSRMEKECTQWEFKHCIYI